MQPTQFSQASLDSLKPYSVEPVDLEGTDQRSDGVESSSGGFYDVIEKVGAVFNVFVGKPIKFTAEYINLKALIVGCALVNCARYVANLSKGLFGIKPEVYMLGPARLIAGVQVPLSLYDIAQNIVILAKGTFGEKVDGLFSVIGGVGTIGDAVSTFASGLESVGAVAAKSIMWATPLLVVSIGLEVAGIIVSLKGMVETHLLSRELFKNASLHKSAEEYTLEDYRQGVEHLGQRIDSEFTFASKYFRSDKEKLADRMLDIELEAQQLLNSPEPEKQQEGKNLLHRTMNILKGRLTKRILSYAVGILAATVCIIGIVILLAVPPLQPLGFALLAVGITVSLIRLGVDYIIDREFYKEMGMNKVPVSKKVFPLFPAEEKKGRKKSPIIRLGQTEEGYRAPFSAKFA